MKARSKVNVMNENIDLHEEDRIRDQTLIENTAQAIFNHLKTIQKAGGKTELSKMALPAVMGFIAGFSDPAGNWIGLWQAGVAPAKAKAKAAPKKAKAVPKKAKAKPAAKQAAKRGKR